MFGRRMRFSGALPPSDGSVASADIPESPEVPATTSISNNEVSRIDAIISLRDQSIRLPAGPCVNAVPWHVVIVYRKGHPFWMAKFRLAPCPSHSWDHRENHLISMISKPCSAVRHFSLRSCTASSTKASTIETSSELTVQLA